MLTWVTAYWPQDFKTIVLQTAVSHTQLLDTVTVLDFVQHSPAWKMCFFFDTFTTFPLCEELLEIWADIDGAVLVLEKQGLFAQQYYESGGWSFETNGPLYAGGIARMLGRAEGLWAQLESMDMANEDAMRTCCEKVLTNGWRSDDGQHSNFYAPYFHQLFRFLARLVAPEGTFDLDALLGDCPEPGAPLLDDNFILTWTTFPARLYLGELLERAGEHERALAQVEPAIAFSPYNSRLKIRCSLLLGRCHVAMGHTVSWVRGVRARLVSSHSLLAFD